MMSRITRTDRTRGLARMHANAPAYWISNKQVQAIQRYVAEENTGGLTNLIGSARAVPRAEDVETTLVGELLNLLTNAGVPLPQAYRSPYGILVTLGSAQSGAVGEGIDKFMKNATDEILSRDPSLILYSDQPHLVRRGIEYLRKGLRIPPGYDALLLVAR